MSQLAALAVSACGAYTGNVGPQCGTGEMVLGTVAVETIADPATRGTSDIAGAHRGGSHRIIPLFSGAPDASDNYEFSLYTVSDGYHTPRHRHHYDQVRYVLSGNLSIGNDVWMNSRQVGWFPAGTSYGPQHNELPATALVLQIGGPDGQGFPSYDRLPAAKAALAERGVFDNGTYRDTDPDGNARNRDAMLAVETEIWGREPFLPPPRYSAPVLMNVDSFRWRATPTAGVRSKHLGTFGEGRLAIEFVSIDEGADWAAGASGTARLIFVDSGRVETSRNEVPSGGAIRAACGLDFAVHALADSVLLVLTLPNFDGVGSTGLARA